MAQTPHPFDLSGKTAVVTGGGTGLGYHMARALIKSGAKVLIAARRGAVLEEARGRLSAECHSPDIFIDTVDLSNSADINAFSDRATELLGGVDIFIGNAAQDLFEAVDQITEFTVSTLLQTNLTSNILLTRNFLPNMRRRRWGRVIYSSSVSSIVSGSKDGMSVYAATKAALNSFARTISGEVGQDQITVNSLVLGVYMTPLMADAIKRMGQTLGPEAADAFQAKMTSHTAIGRFGKPEEVEGIVQLLASNAGSYITGASIPIDGGMGVMIWP